ncbi:hypothetical protein, partial [Escherichia coli]
LMENCTRLDVPVLGEVGSGATWDQALEDSAEHAFFR